MRFYNAVTDTIVTLMPDETGSFNFAIIGNENLVSDDELLDMALGKVPDGWTKEIL